MKDKAFLETNILVYSFDAKEPRKRKRAQEFISVALTMHKGVINWQVIREFIERGDKKIRQIPVGRRFAKISGKGIALDFVDEAVFVGDTPRPAAREILS